MRLAWKSYPRWLRWLLAVVAIYVVANVIGYIFFACGSGRVTPNFVDDGGSEAAIARPLALD